MLFAVFAVAMLLSCNKEEGTVESKHAIGFHSQDVWTKALVSGANDLKDEGFVVYAKGTFTGTGESYKFSRDVAWTTVDGVAGWNYENLEYWLPACTYDFRAYYPASFPATISEEDFSFSEFELAPQYEEQQDILIASAQRATADIETEGRTVAFNFTHLLSCLNVTLKVEQDYRDEVQTDDEGNEMFDEEGNPITIRVPFNVIDANIKAIAFTGVTKIADYNGTWTNHTGTISIGDNMETPVAVTPEGVGFFDEGLLAIPQTINSGDVMLYILADIVLPTGGTKPMEWNLRIPAVTWAPNTKYHYTAVLTADFSIEFEEPKVESWQQEQMSGIVIIR